MTSVFEIPGMPLIVNVAGSPCLGTFELAGVSKPASAMVYPAREPHRNHAPRLLADAHCRLVVIRITLRLLKAIYSTTPSVILNCQRPLHFVAWTIALILHVWECASSPTTRELYRCPPFTTFSGGTRRD